MPIGVLVSSLHEVGPQKGAFSSRESRGFEFDLSLLTAGREPSRPTTGRIEIANDDHSRGGLT